MKNKSKFSETINSDEENKDVSNDKSKQSNQIIKKEGDKDKTEETSLEIQSDIRKVTIIGKVNELMNKYLTNPLQDTLIEIQQIIYGHPDIFDKKYLKKWKLIQNDILSNNFAELIKLKQDFFFKALTNKKNITDLENNLYLDKMKVEYEKEIQEYKILEDEKTLTKLREASLKSTTHLAKIVLEKSEELESNVDKLSKQYLDWYREGIKDIEKDKDNILLYEKSLKNLNERLDLKLETLKDLYNMFRDSLKITQVQIGEVIK